MRKMSMLFAAALVAGTIGSAVALPGGAGAPPPSGGGSNGMPQMPSKQEIEKHIKDYLDSCSTADAEWQKVKISYKQIPSDPTEVLKSTGALPQGAKGDAAMKQFMPMARPYIDKYMGELGTFTNDVEVSVGKVKLAPAQYTFGLVVQDLAPVQIKITGKGLKAPVTVPLKASAAKTPYAKLAIEVKEGKKDDFTIEVGFGPRLCVGKMQLVVAK
jgi:hypothetical protein